MNVTLVTRIGFAARCAAAFVLLIAISAGGPHPRHTDSAFDKFPRNTIWAWESPQDLRAIDPSKYAVAYLDQTIYISHKISSRPRLQRLLVPEKTKVIAVVRIEMRLTAAESAAPEVPQTVATMIQKSWQRPVVSALQLDFDATRSQRDFYGRLIREVRAKMPVGMPLSITALASWCAADDWISGLPVDEAIPMFFRMGRDAGPSHAPGWSYPIREPLCMTSVGVSSDEPWPLISSDRRIYVFHPGPWNTIALENIERVVKK